MVTNGILPIDQLREHTGPCSLLTKRIPKTVFETIYGIKIQIFSEEEREPTSEELLRPYASNFLLYLY
jgi:large subunit GTPase 1